MKILFRGFVLLAAISSAGISSAASVEQNGALRFAAACGFCHGRDAAGGAQGPSLLLSELVADDIDGKLISEVVRNGRIDAGMPAQPNISASDMDAIADFIHQQKLLAESANGGRRGVEPSDLETGNAQLGQLYFDSACTRCHSESGDLAGIASRLQGLPLLRQMLYPRSARPAELTVTTANGEAITGSLRYQDEFTIALIDDTGSYRSWRTQSVTFTVADPLEAHVEQLAHYTDEDMHNVLAYLQTLRQD